MHSSIFDLTSWFNFRKYNFWCEIGCTPFWTKNPQKLEYQTFAVEPHHSLFYQRVKVFKGKFFACNCPSKICVKLTTIDLIIFNKAQQLPFVIGRFLSTSTTPDIWLLLFCYCYKTGVFLPTEYRHNRLFANQPYLNFLILFGRELPLFYIYCCHYFTRIHNNRRIQYISWWPFLLIRSTIYRPIIIHWAHSTCFCLHAHTESYTGHYFFSFESFSENIAIF